MSDDVKLAQDVELPKVFGRYLLLARLSRGGMGEIFLAKHGLAGFEKLCVIKKVLPHLVEDEDFIKRFIDEAQVAIKLQHANIAQVFEVGCIGNEYFLALEYVEGRDLRRLMRVMHERGERLPVDHALFIAREIASGLAYAHRRTDATGASLNLVHCDISPPNVVVSFEGETKIIDFGIAKSAMRRTVTDPKLGFGKFGYMAPEQLVRGGSVDHRTDIYAAGVVLYEMLTGLRMYEPGDTPDYRTLARMVTRGEHPLPSHADATLAPYDGLVAKALRPNPNERYQRAAEFRDAIQTAQVAVNPAMNHDHLGSFMRWLFADDVAQQRAALAQAQAIDIEPFAREMTQQSTATVTFALANLPLRAPAATEVVPRPHVRHPVASNRRAGVIFGALAGLLIVVGGAFALVGSDGETAPAVAAATGEPDARAAIATEPAPVVTKIVLPDAAVPEVAPLPSIQADAAPPSAKATRSRSRSKSKSRSKPKPKPRPEPAQLTTAQVEAKFRKVRREYDGFRAAYGARLAKEWGDLLSYAQYAKSSPDKYKTLDKKIDRFRKKMKAAKGGD